MKALKLLGLVLAALVAVLFVAYAWAGAVVNRKLARRHAVHSVTLQIPFPLSAPTAGRLPADSAARLATGAARERGRHLVQSRYSGATCDRCRRWASGTEAVVPDYV